MKGTLWALAVLLLLPFALAHSPAGTPKNYCEPLSEWEEHDYGLPTGAAGVSYRAPAIDGNVLGNCDGQSSLGSVCGNVDPNDPTASYVDVCGFYPPAGDFDGHHEFSLGWARLLSVSGDGVTSGSVACWGEQGHHPTFGPIEAYDLVLGSSVTFRVMTDASIVPFQGQPDCGDGQVNPGLVEGDNFQTCVGSCSVTFPPGPDGGYLVVVEGTVGHVGKVNH